MVNHGLILGFLSSVLDLESGQVRVVTVSLQILSDPRWFFYLSFAFDLTERVISFLSIWNTKVVKVPQLKD